MADLKSNTNQIDEITYLLFNLGLNKTQAKVYTLLVKNNYSSATRISEISKIARSDIYEILCELSNIGLIETIPEQPKRYHALPLKNGLSILISRRQEITAKLVIQAGLIADNTKEETKENIIDETDEFTVFSDKTKIPNKANKLASETKKSILIMGSNRTLIKWILKAPDLIENTIARGIVLKVIFSIKEKDELSPEIYRKLHKYPTFSSRLTSATIRGTFGIYDNKIVLFSSENSNGKNKYCGMLTNNESFVNIFIDYFENIWINSTRNR